MQYFIVMLYISLLNLNNFEEKKEFRQCFDDFLKNSLSFTSSKLDMVLGPVIGGFCAWDLLICCWLKCWRHEGSRYLTLILSPGLLWPHIFQSERPAATSAKALPPCFRYEGESSHCAAPLFPWFTLHVPQLKPCGLTLTFAALSPLFTVDIMADVQIKVLVGPNSVQKCFFLLKFSSIE